MAARVEFPNGLLPYKGINVPVDPYSVASVDGLQLLSAAASQTCDGNAPAATSNNYAFCGNAAGSSFVSGILLTIHWCSWESDSTTTSCLAEANVDGTADNTAETTSQCASGNKYDNCGVTSPITCTPGVAPTVTSLLGQALYDVCEINYQRAHNTTSAGVSSPLAPLTLSIALESGIFTPVADDTGATVDVPIATDDNGSFVYHCGREPQVWKTAYLAKYNASFDQLIEFIGDAEEFSGGSLITTAKIGGINEDTAELVSTGTALAPGFNFSTPGSGLPDCTYGNAVHGVAGTSSAQYVLNTYSAETPPFPDTNLAQAIELAIGTVVGSTYQTMYAAPSNGENVATDFILAIDTRNLQAFPEIECGVPANSGPCLTDSPGETSDQWSALFLFDSINDLNTSSGAGAAAREYSDFASHFSVSQLLIDATDLQPVQISFSLPGPGFDAAPVSAATSYTVQTNCSPGAPKCQAVAVRQLPCNLENKSNSSNYGTFREGWNTSVNPPAPYYVTPAGIGTLIGWQTDPGPAVLSCGGSGGQSTYGSTILQLGLNNGAQTMEVSVREATNGFCQPDLATALADFPVSNICSYTNN